MRRALFLASLSLLTAGPVSADEGMWTFDNFPAEIVSEKYGETIDQSWLDHVRLNAGRMSNGCSSSIVSSEGLVLTNHHCVIGCVQNLSTPERDYVETGFFTATRDEERPCPAMQIDVLVSIDDVTARVLSATDGKTGEDYTRARDAMVAMLESESCAGRTDTHRCQVVTLYQGGQFKLYSYRKYTDVRLVFAPEIGASFFGGDPDNFNFPRYAFDASFLRLYENGVPVRTPEHLTWSTEAPSEGDPVFVAGNPGGTSRLLTAPQLALLRDAIYPDNLFLMSEWRGRLTEFSRIDAEHERIATSDLFTTENNIKRLRGELKALSDPALFEIKRASDAELKAYVDNDAALAATVGDPWTEIADAQRERAALYSTYYFLESRAGYFSELYDHAVDLVRVAAERGKPNAERLPEYADARLPILERRVLAEEPIEPELEALKLEFWLTKLREYLTADAPATRTFIGRSSPQYLAQSLSASRLADPAFRRALWEGGMEAIDASDDPMIVYVRETDAAARAIRKDYEERVEGPTGRGMERIAQARFAAYGTGVYPDATFTLRLSYGAVEGWEENGRVIAPFTYFAGLYARATDYPPFRLIPEWSAAEDTLDPGIVFNLVSTNDIIGGNSGSPLLSAEGEVVGAVFDGNILSLGGNFHFDPAVNRTVSVSTAAITEALEKVYGRAALVAELTQP
jgi:hypothetical protein